MAVLPIVGLLAAVPMVLTNRIAFNREGARWLADGIGGGGIAIGRLDLTD